MLRSCYTKRLALTSVQPRLLLPRYSYRMNSMFWQRIGLDLTRAKLAINPMTHSEAGRPWLLHATFNWIFCGIHILLLVQCVLCLYDDICIHFIGITTILFGPWWVMMPYMGDISRALNYHTLWLHPDTYQDPLIPPTEYVWGTQHTKFIEEVKIRKERFKRTGKTLQL